MKSIEAKLYGTGHSIYEIAAELNCAPQTVHKRLVKQGVQLRSKAEGTQLAFEKSGRGHETRLRRQEIKAKKEQANTERQYAINLYRGGRTAASIGRELGRCTGTITSWIKKSGGDLRSPSDARRTHTLDEHAFSVIETDAQAYWLGFLTADGGIERSNVLRINLQLRDKPHLERLREFLRAEYEVKECHIVKENYVRHYGYLYANSTELCNDLWRHGVRPRKSKTATCNLDLPEHLQGAYVRGLFDGDGGYCSLNRKSMIQWRLTSNRELLLGVQELMVDALGVNRTKLVDHHSTEWLAYLVYNGTPQVLWIARWMYEGFTVCLPRKLETLLSYLKKFHPGKAEAFKGATS